LLTTVNLLQPLTGNVKVLEELPATVTTLSGNLSTVTGYVHALTTTVNELEPLTGSVTALQKLPATVNTLDATVTELKPLTANVTELAGLRPSSKA
jgi:uncharacterized protein YoxC